MSLDVNVRSKTKKLSKMHWLPSAHIGPICKNPPKVRFKTFVKSYDLNYDCCSLTNVEFEGHSISGKENDLDLLKLDWKNS